MWLLSCDDPICLGGRREWLKPGSEKLLGRSGKNQLPDGEANHNNSPRLLVSDTIRISYSYHKRNYYHFSETFKDFY
jgi:hypothetical protein